MDFPELNPYHWSVLASVLLSIPFFYLVGQFLLVPSENAVLSIGARSAIGLLAVVSALATFYTSGETGFLFYVLLFTVVIVRKGVKVDFSDLIELGWKRGFFLFGLIVCFVLIEACRANVVTDGGVYVGNSDVAHYASIGHFMFKSGIEASAETTTPERIPALYHFGDLWLSGIYSYFFDILPYYSYLLVARTIMIIVLTFMVYGWSRQLNANREVSTLVSFIFLFAVYLEFVEFGEQLSILNLFTFYYPAYCNPSHMIVGVGALPFFLMCTHEEKPILSIIGLWFLPFLNGGLLAVPIVAVVIYFVYQLLIENRFNTLSLSNSLRHLVLVITACIPLVYYQITGRMLSSSGLELDFEQLYLTVHTSVRAVLSYFFILPYFVGLGFFITSKNEHFRNIFTLSLAFLVGTVVAFSVIFPILQGNTTKILSIHFTAILVPVCLIGLAAMTRHVAVWPRYLALFSILLILAQTTRVFVNTDGYKLTFDWSTYIGGYYDESVISKEDYAGARSVINNNGDNLGYFMYNKDGNYGAVHYSNFTQWKALFKGTAFFRMNISPQDTLVSPEQRNYLNRSALGYFSMKENYDSARVTQAMLNYINPELIIRPKESGYVFPESLTHAYRDTIELNNYVFYKR